MGVIKFLWKAMDDSPEDKMLINNHILASQIAEEQKIRSTCKLCKMIFSEGYPYKKTMFGNPKNYVCRDCAKNLGLR